jgi:hypothetical protein
MLRSYIGLFEIQQEHLKGAHDVRLNASHCLNPRGFAYRVEELSGSLHANPRGLETHGS